MGKCKFWKKCGGYRRNSHTCNIANGMYYDEGGVGDRPAGCYRRMEGEK